MAATKTQTKKEATEVAEEEVTTEEVEAPESVIEAVEAAAVATPKVTLPEAGTRIKVVELISDTSGEVSDGTRGSVLGVNEDGESFRVLTDTAKVVTLVAGVDVWRKIPLRKVAEVTED